MIALALVLVVLAVHNVVGNLLLPRPLYVPVNLAVAAGLIAAACAAGLSWRELGLSRATLGAGVGYGSAAFAVVAAVLVLAAVVPATRPLFSDERAGGIAGASIATLAYEALVRIPLGTVLLEEIAFRGVLLGLLDRVASTTAAVVWSSAVFGLWHIIPTVEALRANRAGASAVAVAAGVVVTAVAGVAFCWLRLRSGSVLAPMLAHVGTNSVALLLAVAVLRSR